MIERESEVARCWWGYCGGYGRLHPEMAAEISCMVHEEYPEANIVFVRWRVDWPM